MHCHTRRTHVSLPTSITWTCLPLQSTGRVRMRTLCRCRHAFWPAGVAPNTRTTGTGAHQAPSMRSGLRRARAHACDGTMDNGTTRSSGSHKRRICYILIDTRLSHVGVDIYRKVLSTRKSAPSTQQGTVPTIRREKNVPRGAVMLTTVNFKISLLEIAVPNHLTFGTDGYIPYHTRPINP